MPTLKLSLLGSPKVNVGEQPLTVESRKALALLFYLAVTGEQHSRDHLSTLFWPEQDQTRARGGLRQVLWLLKKAGAEPWLWIEQDALELSADHWCDVHQFRKHIAAEQLHEAVTLYRGDFLTGFTLRDCPEFDQWQFLQADALRRQLASALEALMHQAWDQGAYAAALEQARRWLTLDMLDEAVHRHLMQLYARAGQQAAALRQYKECVRLLRDELDVPPAEETTTLYEAIQSRQFPSDAHVLPEWPPPVAAQKGAVQPSPAVAAQPPARAYNLPTARTPFVGRASELAELEKRLTDPAVRLLTLFGPGGIGKTRVAVQLAMQLHARGQTVVFVDLQPVQSAEQIASAILDALNLSHSTQVDPLAQLIRFCANKSITLVLDNFEHLLDGAALLSGLLQSAPDLRMLVTSRTVLNLQEEWLHAVDGLHFPQNAISARQSNTAIAGYDAIQLFSNCARRVRSGFQLEPEAAGVVRVCQLVEGMPLAIELAAAWARTLTADAIAAEIVRGAELLVTSLRNVPSKHRSMRVVFQRSWQLLTPQEQAVFKRLSVFRGGFNRSAANAVAGASLSTLTALVDKSLLRWQDNDRYTIHELLRQYVAEQATSGEEELLATHNRHSSYYCAFLGNQPGALATAQQETLAWVELDLDNMRSAWQWALAQLRTADLEVAAMPLFIYYQLQSRFQEGMEAFTAALESIARLPPSEERDRVRAVLMTGQGQFAMRLGRLDEAEAALETACALYDQGSFQPQPVMAADPLAVLSILSTARGDYEEAAALGERAQQCAAARNDPANQVMAGYGLTSALIALGQYEKAHRCATETLALTAAVGSRWFTAYVYNQLGEITQLVGNWAAAKQYYQEAHAIRTEFADPEGIAVALNHLGEIALLEGDYDVAQTLYQQSFALYEEIGDRGGLVQALHGLGLAAHGHGQVERSRQNLQWALQLAIDAQIAPLILTALTGVGTVLLEHGAQLWGVRALSFVQHHPAADQMMRKKVENILASPAAKERSALVDAQPQPEGDSLDALVNGVVTELSRL